MEEKSGSVVKLITLREQDMDIIFKINDLLGDPGVSAAIRYALRDWDRRQNDNGNSKDTPTG